MKKFNFSYDKENDDLFLFNPDSKSKGSVELGGIILDYNAKKELVGIQLIDASSIIADFAGEKDIVNKVLNNLKECKVEIKTKNNLIIIKIHLLSEKDEIVPVLSVPSITKTSPALAYS